MSVFDDLANEIRAKLTPRADSVATYNPRDTYFKTSPKPSTNLMQNVLKTGGKVASKSALPLSAATTGYTVGTALDNLPNLIGQPNISKSLSDFILNPETGETASIPESIQPSLTSSPMLSMAPPFTTREASGENVPLFGGLTESGERLKDVASDATKIFPSLFKNIVGDPTIDLLEQSTGFNFSRPDDLVFSGDNQETVIEPTATNQPDGTGMVTTNFDDAATFISPDSAESTAPTDNINLDAVNTTQAPVADSAPVLTDSGALDSAPQRNFEKAKAEGTLTPEKIAQAKSFAAQYGKSFDPETGYSEQNLVSKPTGVSQAAQTAQTATAGFKMPSFNDMKRALRVRFPNAEERNLSGLARVELSKLANAGLVTPSDAATLQGKELSNKLAQQRLDAGPAFNQSQYDNQLIKDMGALQRKLTQNPDYKLTEYEQQRVFEYDASRKNKMGQMAEFYDPFLDQFKEIPKSEEEEKQRKTEDMIDQVMKGNPLKSKDQVIEALKKAKLI